MTMFWGNGDQSHRNRATLTRLMAEAVYLASGLQQPDHPTSEAHARLCHLARREQAAKLRAVVDEYAQAFGFTLEKS